MREAEGEGEVQVNRNSEKKMWEMSGEAEGPNGPFFSLKAPLVFPCSTCTCPAQSPEACRRVFVSPERDMADHCQFPLGTATRRWHLIVSYTKGSLLVVFSKLPVQHPDYTEHGALQEARTRITKVLALLRILE